MAKITVYLPDDVAKRMSRYKKSINVSEVCQQAIQGEIERKTQLLIVSQNARLTTLDIPPHAVLRINVAWIRSKDDLIRVLDGIKHDVFLDFPEGRQKPPRPVLTLPDLVEAMRRYKRIKYFGVTNVKGPETIKRLLKIVPKDVQLIPKIESQKGVDALEPIAAALPYATKYIMLDKEDLYTDIGNDNAVFLNYLQKVREKCWRAHVHALELAGVIFLADMVAPPPGIAA